MQFLVHQRALPAGDVRSAKALQEEFWQWISEQRLCGSPLHEAGDVFNQKWF